MLSQTGQYALRAIIHIGREGNGRPVGAREIAEAGDIPANYLSKILRELVRDGLLDSARGVGGGFRMAKPLEEIRVRDILRPFDDIARQIPCPWGNKECLEHDPCPLDSNWKPVADAFRNFVDNTTLRDLINCKG
jgi:Rrf2 family protein